MEQLQPWITPALVLGLFAWARFMFRDLKENMNERLTDTTKRIDELKTDINTRFAETNRRFDNLTNEMNRRFDEVNRELADNHELADNRERMAKLKGSLEGFLAGRRDREAA